MLLLMPRLLRSSTGLKGLNCPRLPPRLVNKCHTSGLASIHSLNVPSLPFPTEKHSWMYAANAIRQKYLSSIPSAISRESGAPVAKCLTVDQDVLTDIYQGNREVNCLINSPLVHHSLGHHSNQLCDDVVVALDGHLQTVDQLTPPHGPLHC